MTKSLKMALKLAAMVALLACVAVACHFLARRPAGGGVEHYTWWAMGTVAELQTRDHAIANDEARVASEAFDEVERALSVFREESDLSLLVASGSLATSPTSHLARVLAFALEVAEGSGGAFDPTVAPLMEAWGFRGRKVSVPPSESAISNLLANSMGWRRIRVASDGGGTSLVSSGGTRIDLGGIAKGYAVDVAFERLRRLGGENFLINLGGNMRVSGSPEEGRRNWNVAVRDPSGRDKPSPLPRQLMDGEAVATSGSYERFVEIGGRRYSHIIDPRSGHPVDNEVASVTVIAPTAMEADAYSTTLFVLGKEDGGRFIGGRKGCQALFIESNLIGRKALEFVGALCALGPRDAMTPGAEAAANWIAGELRSMGLEPEIDEFDDPDPGGASRVFRNVFATVPGTGQGSVLLLSHYDTKSGISTNFVGANDGGSSTGLLLALADEIANHPRKASVTFAFLDGEECVRSFGDHDGLHGSRHLAKKMREGRERIDAVVLLDMVGDRDLTLTLPRNGDADLKRIFLRAAGEAGRRDAVRLLPYDMIDDHQPFIDAGFRAIDIIDFEYGSLPGLNDYWHTPSDTPDKLSSESLQSVGDIILHMIDLLQQ